MQKKRKSAPPLPATAATAQGRGQKSTASFGEKHCRFLRFPLALSRKSGSAPARRPHIPKKLSLGAKKDLLSNLYL